jgi:hypothetical protein
VCAAHGELGRFLFSLIFKITLFYGGNKMIHGQAVLTPEANANLFNNIGSISCCPPSVEAIKVLGLLSIGGILSHTVGYAFNVSPLAVAAAGGGITMLLATINRCTRES